MGRYSKTKLKKNKKGITYRVSTVNEEIPVFNSARFFGVGALATCSSITLVNAGIPFKLDASDVVRHKLVRYIIKAYVHKDN